MNSRSLLLYCIPLSPSTTKEDERDVRKNCFQMQAAPLLLPLRRADHKELYQLLGISVAAEGTDPAEETSVMSTTTLSGT